MTYDRPRLAMRQRALTPLLLCMFTGSVWGADAPPGALACTGCHANQPVAQTAPGPLSGLSSTEILSALRAFRSGARPATIMDRIAKGFSDDELVALAVWFGAR